MSKIWTRGAIAALGLLVALPAISSAHAHYTGVAPASVQAQLMSTSAHAKVQTVKHTKKHKKHKKHKSSKSSAKKTATKTSAHAKHKNNSTKA